MNRKLTLAAFLAISVTWLRADDARQLVAEAQHRSQVASEHYEGKLEVVDAKGKTTDKRWAYDRLGSHGNSKVVLRFTAPAEVKGVALLIQNHPERSSDQWMWTPAISRDRRIAMQDRRTRFFGTDFSFEDLEERDVEQYDYSLKGEEVVDDGLLALNEKARGSKAPMHMHLLETAYQKEYAMRRTGKTAVRHLHDLGLLGPHMTLGHGVWMSEDLGQTWRSIGDGLPTQINGAVAWSPAGSYCAVQSPPKSCDPWACCSSRTLLYARCALPPNILVWRPTTFVRLSSTI